MGCGCLHYQVGLRDYVFVAFKMLLPTGWDLQPPALLVEVSGMCA